MAFHGEGKMKIGIHMTTQLIPWNVLKQLPNDGYYLNIEYNLLDATYCFKKGLRFWEFTGATVTLPKLPWST